MTSEPSARKRWFTAARVPLPSASIAISAATPITIPRAVSAERSALLIRP